MASKKKEETKVEETKETVEAVKPYEFRKLNATDILPMSKVIKAIGINDFAQCFFAVYKDSKANTKDVEVQMGMAIFSVVQLAIDKYENCYNELFTLMSKTSNLSLEEVHQLDFNVYFDMLYDFCKKEEFETFGKAVLRLLGIM